MADKILISASILDAKGIGTSRSRNRQQLGIYVASAGMDVIDMVAYHDAFIAALDDVTDGKIAGSSITILPALPAGLKGAPVAGSDVQVGGLLTFSVVGTSALQAYRVPALKSSLFGADGQSVPNAGDMATFITLLLGGGDPARAASDEDGVDLEAFLAGKKSFRK